MDGFSHKVVVLTIFVLFLNLFFFRSIGSLGLALLLISTSVALIAAFVRESIIERHKNLLIGFGVFNVIFSLILISRANPTVTFITILLALNTILLAHYTITANRFISSSAELLMAGVKTFAGYLKILAQTFSGNLEARQETRSQVLFSTRTLKKSPLLSAAIGLLISVPILTILLSLLASGDPIFGKTIENFLGSAFIKELLPRVILSLILFVGLMPFLYIHHDAFKNPARVLQRFNLIHEYTVVMGLVAGIMALFLAVQWQYVFIPKVSGLDLSQFGFSTYSEYVNRGFSELLFASIFIYILVWVGLIILRSTHAVRKNVLLTTQMVVLVEFAIFVFSIFRRIYLYQLFHGLTLIRVYGGFFLVLLLGYTAILAARHFWQRQWVLADIGLTVSLFVIFSLFNVEGVIANQNPPTVNGRVDFTYLARLSTDGYQGWKEAFRQVRINLGDPSFPAKVNYSIAVNPGEPKSETPFTKEDIRLIAYSGVALEKIMDNYNYLVFKYGSPSDQKTYLTLLHQYAINRIDQILKNPLFENPTAGFGNPNLVSTNFKNETKYLKDTLAKERAKLVTNINDLESGKIDASEIEVKFYSPLRPYYKKIDFNQTSCQNWSLCTSMNPGITYDYLTTLPHSFFSITRPPESKQTNWFERLINWNGSENAAYQKIKVDISLTSLLDLQMSYFEDYKGLSATKSINYTPVDYDADIPLNVPFLTQLD